MIPDLKDPARKANAPDVDIIQGVLGGRRSHPVNPEDDPHADEKQPHPGRPCLAR
jgi:hypothetical protein